MSNDSPKIKWSCQRVNEQVGVGIPRQFSVRDGLLDQIQIHGSSRQIETFEEESPKHGIFLSNCTRTVHERVVFSLLGLAFERKQIPRFVGNVSS